MFLQFLTILYSLAIPSTMQAVAMDAAKAKMTMMKSTMLYHDFLLKNNFGVKAITLQNTCCKIIKTNFDLSSNLKEKVYGEGQLQVADDHNGWIAGTAEGDLDDDEGDVEGDEQKGDQSEPDVLHCPPQLPMQVLLVAAPGEKR